MSDSLQKIQLHKPCLPAYQTLPIVMLRIFYDNSPIVGCPQGFYCRIIQNRVRQASIFGRANFHPAVVSLGINVSSKVGDDGRRTGEGTEQCCLGKRSPRHYNLDFSTSNLSVYNEVFNLGILPLDNFPKKKRNEVTSQVLKFAF